MSLFYETLIGGIPCVLTGRKKQITCNNRVINRLVEIEYKCFFGLFYTKRFVPMHNLYTRSEKIEEVKEEDLITEINLAIGGKW